MISNRICSTPRAVDLVAQCACEVAESLANARQNVAYLRHAALHSILKGGPITQQALGDE